LSSPPAIIQIVLALIVVAAAMFDFRYRRVPNWLTLSGVIVGIGLNFFLFETEGLLDSLKGLGLAFLIYFPLYLLRGMGAGDVKLMAAVGSIVGWKNWLGILVITSLMGGIAAIVLITAKGRTRKTFENIWLILMSLRTGQTPYSQTPQLDVRSPEGVRLPHAVVIAFGSLGFLIAAAIWAPK
jgi:prepilin peptidase CpaA